MGGWYTVQRGDSLSKIAQSNGFGDWRTIYRDPHNSEFRQLRPDPDLIYVGDRLFIPEAKAKKVSCTTGREHTFHLHKAPVAAPTEDLIPEARRRHKAYLDARDDFVKWSIDPEVCGKAYIGGWCEGLAKDAKFKKRIDLRLLEADKDAHLEQAKARRERYEKLADALVEILKDARLIRQLRKMDADGQREWASLVQGLGESVAGGVWIEHELEDEEGFWASVKTKEGSGELAEKTEAVKKPFEAAEPFLDALAEFAGTIVRVKKEQAVEYIAQLVSIRFRIAAVNLVTQESIEIRGGMVAAVLYKREVTVLKATKLLDEGTVHAIGGALGAFAKVIAVANFAAKLNVAYNDPSLKNSISAIGALAELLGAFDSVNGYVNKMTRFGRTLGEDGAPKTLEAAAEGGEIAAKVGVEAGEEVAVGFGKILAEGLAKKLSVLAVVAGVADTITGSQEAYEEYGKGNFAGVAAKAAVAAGGALLAVGGTMIVTGFAADATVVGLPLGIVLFIGGTIVGAAGAIASLIWSESDLEVWAEHCLYGHRYGRDKYADYKGSFGKQIGGLQEILYQVRVKGGVKQDVTRVEIEPTNLTKASKVTCAVSVSGDDFGSTMAGVRNDLPLRDDQRDCRIEFENESVKKIELEVRMPYASGDYLGGRRTVTWSQMTLVMYIHPDGDGGSKVKRVAELKQGFFDWVGSIF